jgi:hypothetical protein
MGSRLIVGAEIDNSSSSSLDYIKPIWPKLAAIPLNTVLPPLSWELIEPSEDWCNWYHRGGNPLLIPETNGGATGEANVFYAIGELDAIGFSPFGIDSWGDKDNDLGKSYEVLTQLAPLILRNQGSGKMAGFVLDRANPSAPAVLNGYLVSVSLDEIFGSEAQKGFGLIIATGPNEFLGGWQRISSQIRTQITGAIPRRHRLRGSRGIRKWKLAAGTSPERR